MPSTCHSIMLQHQSIPFLYMLQNADCVPKCRECRMPEKTTCTRGFILFSLLDLVSASSSLLNKRWAGGPGARGFCTLCICHDPWGSVQPDTLGPLPITRTGCCHVVHCTHAHRTVPGSGALPGRRRVRAAACGGATHTHGADASGPHVPIMRGAIASGTSACPHGIWRCVPPQLARQWRRSRPRTTCGRHRRACTRTHRQSAHTVEA